MVRVKLEWAKVRKKRQPAHCGAGCLKSVQNNWPEGRLYAYSPTGTIQPWESGAWPPRMAPSAALMRFDRALGPGAGKS